MATPTGYTTSGKNITIDLSKTTMPTANQLSVLQGAGYTVNYINSPTQQFATGGTGIITNDKQVISGGSSTGGIISGGSSTTGSGGSSTTGSTGTTTSTSTSTSTAPKQPTGMYVEGKTVVVDLSETSRLTDAQAKKLRDNGFTIKYVNDPNVASGIQRDRRNKDDSNVVNDVDDSGAFFDQSGLSPSAVANSNLNRYGSEVNQALIDEAKKAVRIAQQEADIKNRALQEQLDILKKEFDMQEEEFKGKFKNMWDDIEEHEKTARKYISELEGLHRDQYKDYVTRLGRVISGRKSGAAADMAAQGFNANVIGNLTSQVDEKFADERLKVQTFLTDGINDTLERYNTMYETMNRNKSNLTQNEIQFGQAIEGRMKYLEGLKKQMADNNVAVLAPVKALNDAFLEKLTGIEAGIRGTAAYEESWTANSGNEQARISLLRSQLNAFIGQEMNPDGTKKYDFNQIPSEKMTEFSRSASLGEAYAKALDYLNATSAGASSGGGSTPTYGGASSGATPTYGGGTGAGSGSGTSGAPSTTGKLDTAAAEELASRLIDEGKLTGKTKEQMIAGIREMVNQTSLDDLEKELKLIDSRGSQPFPVNIPGEFLSVFEHYYTSGGEKNIETLKKIISQTPGMRNMVQLSKNKIQVALGGLKDTVTGKTKAAIISLDSSGNPSFQFL